MACQYWKQKDIELVKMVQDGDSDAFVELVARYNSFIKWTASRFNGMEQEDLCQEGLIGLLNATKAYRAENTSFRTYAKICIMNRCISSVRKAGGSASTVSLDDETCPMIHEVSDPETVFIKQEYYYLLRENVFHMLSKLEREVFFLYFNGYKYGEIASKLSISEKAADNALQRVRRKMKHILKFG